MDPDRPSNNSSNNESSPYHWDSNSSDHLLTSPTASSIARNPRNLTPGQRIQPALATHARTDSLEAPPSSLRTVQKRNSGGDAAGRKRMSPVMRGHFEDADAAIVANNRQDRSRSPPKPSPTPATQTVRTLSDKSKDRDSGWEETLPSGSSSSRSLQLSEQSPIKKKPVGEGEGERGRGGEQEQDKEEGARAFSLLTIPRIRTFRSQLLWPPSTKAPTPFKYPAIGL